MAKCKLCNDTGVRFLPRHDTLDPVTAITCECKHRTEIPHADVTVTETVGPCFCDLCFVDLPDDQCFSYPIGAE